MATRITPLPTPVPQSSDPENFDPRADAFLTALPTFAEEANLVADEMDEAVDTAQAAASASLSSASFVGRWEDQSGPAAPPYSVFHGGLFWSLLEPIADVAASEPSPYNEDWAVTGAPSWYNNFAVGDFLDTARSPGTAWLRRDGRAYAKTAFPELAALMPDAPVGVAWETSSPPFLNPTGTRSLGDLLWDGTQYVYVANAAENANATVFTSPDGRAPWTPRALLSSTGVTNSGGLAFGNGRYVALHPVLAANSYWSEDLENWTASSNVPGTNFPRLLTFDPASEKFYCTPLGRTHDLGGFEIYKSSLGETWTLAGIAPSSSGNSTFLKAVGGRLFIGVDDWDLVEYSVDEGATFTSIPKPNSENILDITHDGVSFYVLTSAGVYRTADFSTYEKISDQTGMNKIGFDGFGFYGWKSASPTAFFVSSDAETWQRSDIPDIGPIYNVVHGGVFPVQKYAAVGAVSGAGGSDFITAGGSRIPNDWFVVPGDNRVNGWIKAASDSAGTVGYAGVPEAPLTGGSFAREGGAWTGLGTLAKKDAVAVGDIEATGTPDGTKALFGDGTWKEPGGGGGMVYPGAGVPVSSGSAWDTSKTAPAGDLVGTTDAQTLLSKTLGTGTKESVTTGSTVTISDAAAPFQKITLTGNVTATINLSEGASRSVWINPGSYTVTWPAGTVWAGGSAPSLPASKWSLITLTGMPGNTAGMAALVGSQP